MKRYILAGFATLALVVGGLFVATQPAYASGPTLVGYAANANVQIEVYYSGSGNDYFVYATHRSPWYGTYMDTAVRVCNSSYSTGLCLGPYTTDQGNYRYYAGAVHIAHPFNGSCIGVSAWVTLPNGTFSPITYQGTCVYGA